MDLYIDIENLRSFIHSKDREDFGDCLRMLRRQLHVIYNTDKAAIKNDEEIIPWIQRISDGRGASEDVDLFRGEKFPQRPIKSNSYNDWTRKKLSSVYLIKDVDISKLKNRGCVLLGDEGEELEILTRLFCGSDYDYHHLYDLQKNFHSWEQLTEDNQLLPCTDIVINDRYLFAEEDKSVVQYNLSSMLKALTNNVKNRVDVVIYTLYDKLNTFGKDEAVRIVKQVLEKSTGIKPNVTFVTSKASSRIMHDRFVITNYRLLRSGDSFNYFYSNGERKTNGGSLDVDSLANYETFVFVESLLEKLQRIYDEILKSKNNDLIIGAKSSRFINF